MKNCKKAALFLLCAAMLLPSCTDTTGENTSAVADVTASADTADAAGESPSESKYVNAEFSIPGGFYSSGQSLTLSLPENAPDGAYIAYTLDGNEPARDSTVYTDAITVADEGTTVVRAACFDKDGNNIGRIKTNSYIRSDAGITTAPYTVSIATDEVNLYGDTGIISNYNNSGKEWERVCHVEIFAPDGSEAVSQDAGIRIFGGSSRSVAQKSFRLVARKTGYYDELLYNGNGSFDYAFFGNRTLSSGEKLERFDRLVLRNGGNDSLMNRAQDGDNASIIRDAAVNNFAVKYAPAVASQASCFAAVYLNGEYYGILDMKEDIDNDYVSNLYGIEDKDNVTVVKSELDTSLICDGDHDESIPCGRFCGVWFYYEVDSGSEKALDDFKAFCEKVINSDPSQHDEIYEQVKATIDIENFIQYTALNLYFCNTDWAHNNLKLWCYTGDTEEGTYKDGRWRFAMRDCDFAMGRYQSFALPELYTLADTNTFDFVLSNYYSGQFEYIGNYADPLYLKGLLAFCLRNDEFRADFKEYCELISSAEAQAFLENIVSEQRDTLSPLIKAHIERWEEHLPRTYGSRTWTRQMNAIDNWVAKRNSYFIDYMNSSLANFE